MEKKKKDEKMYSLKICFNFQLTHAATKARELNKQVLIYVELRLSKNENMF